MREHLETDALFVFAIERMSDLKIIKEGNIEKARRYEENTYLKKFVCPVCDCEWQYDTREADFEKGVRLMQVEYNGLDYVSDCPCCGHKEVICQ